MCRRSIHSTKWLEVTLALLASSTTKNLKLDHFREAIRRPSNFQQENEEDTWLWRIWKCTTRSHERPTTISCLRWIVWCTGLVIDPRLNSVASSPFLKLYMSWKTLAKSNKHLLLKILQESEEKISKWKMRLKAKCQPRKSTKTSFSRISYKLTRSSRTLASYTS